MVRTFVLAESVKLTMKTSDCSRMALSYRKAPRCGTPGLARRSAGGRPRRPATSFPLLAAVLVLGPTACGGPPGDGAPAGAAPGAEYWVFAGRESRDVGYRVRFGPEGADAETVPVDELGARVLEAALRFRITAPSGETPDPAMAGDARHHGDDHAGDHAAMHAEHMKDPAHVERHAVRHGGDAAVAVEPRC